MEKYQLAKENMLAEEQNDTEAKILLKTKENKIYVKASGKTKFLVSQAEEILKKSSIVLLEGHGKAVNRTISVAEVLKRNVEGVDSQIFIDSVKTEDTWEPKEGNLDTYILPRRDEYLTF